MRILQKFCCEKPLRNNGNQRLFLWGVFFLLLCVAVLATCAGAVSISPGELISLMQNKESVAYRIVVYVRLPRILGAVLAGAALSVSGVIIQSVLGNPLASPNTIGVNTGAGLSVLLISALFPGYMVLIPFAAFLGALLTSLLILMLAAGNKMSTFTLILTGFAISSIWSGGMSAVMILYPDAYVGAGNFLAGGLSGITLDKLKYPLIFAGLGFSAVFIARQELNIISLGQDTAKSLGMNVHRSRLVFIVLASLLAGAAVSFAGLIGFVGLIVPHMARLLAGNDHKTLVPASALFGGLFVLFCDLAARLIFAPYELPVGVIMSFIGGPFFIYLLYYNRGKLR